MRFTTTAFAVLLLCIFSLGPLSESWAATGNNNDYGHLKRYSQVYELIQHYYVRDVTNEELTAGALKGMLQNLDPHSTFLDEKEYKEMRENTAGEFFGVGIEISHENGQVIVVSPIEDTPAYKAGILAGDIILAVDGAPTQDLSSQEVVSKIRGPKGSEVELLILHKDSRSPLTISIKRDAIPVISVKARYLEDGYLWVRLTRFSERTTQELEDALKKAMGQTTLKGIVLDLRNNPGGLLDQAVAVSDLFLYDGMIVSMRGKIANQDREFKASRDKNKITEPVVVLVNSGSASASEIVAGALQDRKRAVLLGERTFGKGSVQQIMPIPGTATAIKMTTALYYTPNGRSIQAKGIDPDLLVPFEAPHKPDSDLQKFNVREQDLSKHLENGNSGKGKAEARNGVDPDAKSLLERDNQLRMGLELVRSMPVLLTLQRPE
ncbi:MAG: S41 family peptidase [Deltaproteobacteria bacterium]|jgi:carboxyl-terminal processing protease|nr:S41 family peptidase [Deltaproteobacteria bacterium]